MATYAIAETTVESNQVSATAGAQGPVVQASNGTINTSVVASAAMKSEAISLVGIIKGFTGRDGAAETIHLVLAGGRMVPCVVDSKSRELVSKHDAMRVNVQGFLESTNGCKMLVVNAFSLVDPVASDKGAP